MTKRQFVSFVMPEVGLSGDMAVGIAMVDVCVDESLTSLSFLARLFDFTLGSPIARGKG